MLSRWGICFLVWAHAGCPDAAATPPTPQDHEEVVRLVERAIIPHQLSFESVFNVQAFDFEHAGQVGDRPDFGPSLRFEDRFHVWVFQGQLRTERWSFEPHAPGAIFHQTSIWGSGCWASWNDLDPVVLLYPFASPTDAYGYDLEFNRIGEWFLDPDQTLAAVIRGAKPATFERFGRDVVFRWTSRDTEDENLWGEVRISVGEQVLVTGLARQVTRYGSKALPAKVLQTWTVQEWVSVNGLLVPAKARLDIETEGMAQDGKPHHRWVVYSRESIRSLDALQDAAHRFAVPLKPGMNILDGRINASYAIGDDWLSLDGLNYKLRDPIDVILGVDLLDRLDSAQRINGAGLTTDVDVPDPARHGRWRDSGAIVGISLGAAVLVGAVWRRKASK